MHWINKLQSQSLDKISFYRLTTQFANYVKADSNFTSVQITGHSLGGGLSIITGAQASIPAVGLSGPNALISGASFDPPVTKEQLNQVSPRMDAVYLWFVCILRLLLTLPVILSTLEYILVHVQHRSSS